LSYRILLVEDEAPIADSVAYSLQSEGFDVKIAADGLAGLSLFRGCAPDLIILDLMLPKLAGLDLCRIIRNESRVPIIMLTAKTEEIDRIIGLELGADDYLSKPFSLRELTARVRSVLRRVEAARGQNNQVRLHAAGISLDVVRRRVSVDGRPVHLPPRQFALLKALMANKGRIVTRKELFQTVWEADAAYDTGTLDVHIRWLRERIEDDPSHPTRILTVRGVGYRIASKDDE
jgi:two-component system response regulator RegX3